MIWIAPWEKATDNAVLEKRIRDAAKLPIHGVEKTHETGRLCRLVAVRKGLGIHCLESEFTHGGNINSYYDDPHDATRLRQSILQKAFTGET